MTETNIILRSSLDRERSYSELKIQVLTICEAYISEKKRISIFRITEKNSYFFAFSKNWESRTGPSSSCSSLPLSFLLLCFLSFLLLRFDFDLFLSLSSSSELEESEDELEELDSDKSLLDLCKEMK